MTARLVTFPVDRARPPVASNPTGADATIIILPVVRIERYDVERCDVERYDVARSRPRRRRRRVEITEGGSRP